MNIKIEKKGPKLLLHYSPDRNDAWIDERIQNDETIHLKCSSNGIGAFVFEKGDLVKKIENSQIASEFTDDIGESNHIWIFKLGVKEKGYYRIPARIVASKNDVLIHASVDIKIDFFVASVLNTRIVPIIDKMIKTCLVIGGDAENAIPIDEYNAIIKKLPSREELHLYAQSRIEGVLAEYVPDVRESSIELSEYIRRRYKRVKSQLGNVHSRVNLSMKYLMEMEYTWIEFTLKRLKELLHDVKNFTEHQWQKEIEDIILLLFPWYTAKVSQLRISESLEEYNLYRLIDLALVSMTGNVDIVEIKRPENSQLLSRKPNYRGNYIPSRDLSAAVMQAEKYLENLVQRSACPRIRVW